jgi:hypothetical protein
MKRFFVVVVRHGRGLPLAVALNHSQFMSERRELERS